MNVDKVLESFENLVAILAQSASRDLHEKLTLMTVLQAYPFPDLSSQQSWRRKQIESAIEQQLIRAKSV